MSHSASKPVFTGIAVALVTFFDEHGHVDNEATARHAAHLADRGVRAVVVAGTTGEAAHLAIKERLQLFDAVKAAVPAHMPVLLGTGNLAAGVSVTKMTKMAADHGASAALVLSPSKGDVREFYGEAVAAAGHMPVLAYHNTAVSEPGITMEELKAVKCAGIKDSTGDAERIIDLVSWYKGWIYTGTATMVTFSGLLGCTGAILAAANLEPELCADAFAGSIAAQKALVHAHKIVAHEGVKGIKQELARKFGTSTACR
jgi:dihydrodipicolinate synthase/N-acetylneuraminate lyase